MAIRVVVVDDEPMVCAPTEKWGVIYGGLHRRPLPDLPGRGRQQTLIQASDPSNGSNWFGTAGWSVSYAISYHPTALATAKVVAVVLGHVVGVIAAHDRALAVLPDRHRITGQLPLLLAMVAFTVGGSTSCSRPDPATGSPPPDLHRPRRVPVRRPGPDRLAQRRVAQLDQRAAADQGPVDGRPVIGQEVGPASGRKPSTMPAIRSRTSRTMAASGSPPPAPALPGTASRTSPSPPPAGIGRPGRPNRRPAPHRPGQARPASSGCAAAGDPNSATGSDSRLKPVSTTTSPCAAATSRRCSTDPDRSLDPPIGPGQPGDHGQVLADRRLHRSEPRLEHPARGEPGRGEQAGDLVEDAELLGHGAAVGVGVHQGRTAAASGQLGRNGHRHRRAPRGSCRSHRDHPAAAERRWRLVGQGSGTTVSASASGSVAWSRNNERARRSSGTTAAMPSRAARRRCSSAGPWAPRPAVAPGTCRWSTAAWSRPGASSATTAASAWPAEAAASTSGTSTQRRSTTTPGSRSSRPSTEDSQAAPDARIRTMTTGCLADSAAPDHGDHGELGAAVDLEEDTGVLVGDAEHELALTDAPNPRPATRPRSP